MISVADNDCFTFFCLMPAIVTIKGMKLTTSGAYGNGIAVFGQAQVYYYNIDFGACIFYHIWSAGSGVQVSNNQGNGAGNFGDYTISGGALAHIGMGDMGQHSLIGVTVTLTGTPAFANAFIDAVGPCQLDTTVMTFPGAATGKRYSAVDNAFINTSGGGANYFPGNAAGTTATGGQYA